MRIINYINGIEGVATGGIATANIPTGRRYHGLKIFVFGNDGATPTPAVYTDPADILESVRMIVNGVVIRDLTPSQIRRIALLNGQTVGNNEVPMFFSEPWRASVMGEEATSFDLAGQAKATLELKFRSTVNAPSAKILASYDFGRNVDNGKPFLAIVKQLRFTYNVPSGRSDLTTLPTRFPIQRVLLDVSTGTINNAEVYRDGAQVFEASNAENARLLADYKLAGAQFGFPIVFDAEQQISSALLVDRELNVRVDCSGAATLTALVEHRANGYI